MQELMEKASISVPYGNRQSISSLAIIPQGQPEGTKEVLDSGVRVTKHTQAGAGPGKVAFVGSCFGVLPTLDTRFLLK